MEQVMEDVVEWATELLVPCAICGGKAEFRMNYGCNIIDSYIVCTGESCPSPRGPFANYCGYHVSKKTARDLIREWNEQNRPLGFRNAEDNKAE